MARDIHQAVTVTSVRVAPPRVAFTLFTCSPIRRFSSGRVIGTVGGGLSKFEIERWVYIPEVYIRCMVRP